jgi:hypothetical protein
MLHEHKRSQQRQIKLEIALQNRRKTHMTKIRFIFLRVGMLFLFMGFILPGFVSATPYIEFNTGSSSPLLSTYGSNPNTYNVSPGNGLDGVAQLIVDFGGKQYGGSAVLLAGGKYLLTAAHMVDNGTNLVSSLAATFYTTGGPVTTYGSQYYLPSGWTGSFTDGYDIAIVKLSTPVTGIQGYSIYSGNAFGSNVSLAGYGIGGTGTTGTNSSSYRFGTLRAGQNTYEAYWWGMGGSIFAYDFDNGTETYNTIKNLGFASNLGLDQYEVLATPGDSGGPSFVDGKIAGIHSFYSSYGKPYDFDNILNGTFGELGGDTDVAYFADWINQTIAVPVPLPGALFLLAPGLMAVGFLKRKFM